ncbi:MAG: aldehyde dehydrogenase family protein [Pirellulaceae bacterium]
MLDSEIADLKRGSLRLQSMPLPQRRKLLDKCVDEVLRQADAWVAAACQAKGIPVDRPLAAEECLGGPASTMRYLQLVAKTLLDVEHFGQPQLPGPVVRNSLGRLAVPVMPVARLYDALLFRGIQASVWLLPEADNDDLFTRFWETVDPANPKIAGVLGAGNVSSIPVTDALHQICFQNASVLLKLNPVNAYLEPTFQKAFRPLIESDLLRIVCGGSDVGAAMVHHPDVSAVHLTGSHHTHDAIIWGADHAERDQRMQADLPLLNKKVTSELGNVTPWIVVPGSYTKRQLRSQAEHVVASIVNNASFNCIATKVIVTCEDWPQREIFLSLVESMLQRLPARQAYYPGAVDRYERAVGKAISSDDGTLPWTLIRNASPEHAPELFKEESFVCVCAETAVKAASAEAFLEKAVDFVNHQLFGTLSMTLTIPEAWHKANRELVELAVSRLKYGSVCINHWAGIVYGMMSPPWGGHHGSTLRKPESGLGFVHNTFSLKNVDKTVLVGPLVSYPKPVWFPTHRSSHRAAKQLAKFYQNCSPLRLPSVFWHAMRS